MLRILSSSTFAAFTILWGSSAAVAQTQTQLHSADCSLRINSSSTNWFIEGYDPFASSDPIATFDVTFSNDGGAACVFDPVFVTDQEPFGLSDPTRRRRVTYTLLDTFSNTNATPLSGRTIANATRRAVVVQPRSQQVARYQFAADDGGLRADGLYSQQVSLVAEQRGTGNVLASRALVLGVNVLPSAVLGLSGQYRRNGGQALVDLGELQKGIANVLLQLRVSSTRAYRLEFVSKNAGLLKMANANWSVPYEIAVGDKTLSLEGRAAYESSNQDSTKDVLPLKFIVNDVTGKRAGLYADLITVSIAPR